MAIISGKEYTAEEQRAQGIPDIAPDTEFDFEGSKYKVLNTGRGTRQYQLVNSAPSEPHTSDQLQPYLDRYNETKIEEKAARDDFFKSPEELKQEFDTYVIPKDTSKPSPPDLAALFTKQREDQNIGALETQLNDLNQTEATLLANLRKQKAYEETDTVPLNVIAGRIGEEERQAMTRLDFLGTVKGRLVDELKTRYNVIDNIIQLTGQTYQLAREAYDKEFENNLQFYRLLKGVQEKRLDLAMQDRQKSETDLDRMNIQIEEWRREDVARAQESATANLQIYAKYIQSGNLDFSTLSEETKLNINKLEIQSGLGIGFISSVRRDNPEGEIKSITTRETADGQKYADVLIQNPDGSLRIDAQYLGSVLLPKYAQDGGSGGSVKITPDLINKAVKVIDGIDLQAQQQYDPTLKKGDKLLSLDEAQQAREAVRAFVGNDEMGDQLFDRAISTGGFKKWKW